LDSSDYRFTQGVGLMALSVAPICMGGLPGVVSGAVLLVAGLLIVRNNSAQSS
jgi:hypothetical protein